MKIIITQIVDPLSSIAYLCSNMIDYKAIQDHCRKTTETGMAVLDDFLIYYAADREKLGREMDNRLAPYRHVIRNLDPSWINYFKAQYIAHRLFKKDGLIQQYMNHSAVKDLSEEERAYLKQQSAQPWRFSFSVITGRPAEDFYEMQDVFTSERFLLYSTGVTQIVSEHPVALWFNLIAFNGRCWQSYGPIGHYQSFGPDDIRYYASELNPREWFEEDAEILENVGKNPFPYMMLINGATLPVMVHKDDRIEHHFAEYDDDAFTFTDLETSFRIEYNDGLYRLSLNKWSDHPHFAIAYYDEKEELLLVCAMTARGFEALIKKLNQCGYELDPDPDFQVNVSMLTTAQTILKKKHISLQYSALFETPTSPEPEQPEALDKLNEFLSLALPDINNGRQPDIEALVKRTGVDPDLARQIVQNVLDKLGR